MEVIFSGLQPYFYGAGKRQKYEYIKILKYSKPWMRRLRNLVTDDILIVMDI